MSDSALRIEVLKDNSNINLRGNAADKNFLKAVESATGCALPLQPNTIAVGAAQGIWLGPNEWLVVTDAASASAVTSALDEALLGQHVAINDLSGAQLTLRLTGDSVRDLLSKGCPLDLHPNVFEAGACAQTGLAKANVVIIAHDDGPGVDLIVRRSFSEYLLQWLQKAGAEYGIEFA